MGPTMKQPSTAWRCEPANKVTAYITAEFADSGQVYRILYAINPSTINATVFWMTIEDMQHRIEKLKN